MSTVIPRYRKWLLGALLPCVFAACGLALAAYHFFGDDLQAPFPQSGNDRIPLALLGDSNSHSYHDDILLPKKEQRGGAFRASTWQWTELLNTSRGRQIYQGEMGTWGTPIKVAEVLDGMGLGGRAPRKKDFRFNFAVSGAECEDLMTGYYRQAPRLLSLMNRTPDAWKNGIVVIHIGVNSIGQPPELERYAKEGLTSPSRTKILACIDFVRTAIALIRSRHDKSRFLLVGMLNGIDEPGAINRWTSRQEVENISSAVDLFNNGLKELARGDAQIAYFDQTAWLRSLWGSRDAEGRPAYRDVELADGRKVTLTIGDAPGNAVLGDEHAGSVWNALWAQALIVRLNTSFDTRIAPMTGQEVSTLTQPVGKLNSSTGAAFQPFMLETPRQCWSFASGRYRQQANTNSHLGVTCVSPGRLHMCECRSGAMGGAPC